MKMIELQDKFAVLVAGRMKSAWTKSEFTMKTHRSQA